MLCCFLSSGVAAQDIQDNTNADQPLNTVSLTIYGLAPVAVYERLIPIHEKVGVIASFGGFYYGDVYLGYTVGATLYTGTPKHRAELGGAYLNDALTLAYGAYRYTGKNGLFAKGGLGYTFMPDDGDGENGVVPILAIGYAF
jgi:hypothetical protein